MDYFPLFCDIAHKPVLLVGGGEVALRKAKLLLDAKAQVTVVALTLSGELVDLVANQQLVWIEGAFEPEHLANKWLVIAATNCPHTNAFIHVEATARRIFCNAVDDIDNGSCIMPAVVDRGTVVVAISSGGKAPVLARLIREKVEALLPNHLGQLAALAGKLRSRVKRHFSHMSAKRQFFERLMTDDNLGRLLTYQQAQQDDPHFTERLQQKVDQAVDNLFETATQQVAGEVILVGAGPGDPGLLTIHALRHLQQADIIVYDRLVSEEIIKLARRDAELVYVGKKAGYHCVPQDEINQALVNLAKQGHKVVRLKGGDPFIFGRGAEEISALMAEGIKVQVVPGITAASGCSAYTGIALTHRDHAQSVSFITAHDKAGITEIDWPSRVDTKQTLVFYMGLSHSQQIKTELMSRHYAMNTAVAIIEKGTTPEQKTWIGELGNLDKLAQAAQSPALIIVGSVVNLYHSQGLSRQTAESISAVAMEG